MSWDFCTTTEQVARKTYRCDASEWIINCEVEKEERLTEEEQNHINSAKKDGWKIKAGQVYRKTKGKWDGDFTVFRCRPELDDILSKYDVYSE